MFKKESAEEWTSRRNAFLNIISSENFEVKHRLEGVIVAAFCLRTLMNLRDAESLVLHSPLKVVVDPLFFDLLDNGLSFGNP